MGAAGENGSRRVINTEISPAADGHFQTVLTSIDRCHDISGRSWWNGPRRILNVEDSPELMDILKTAEF